MRAVAHARVPTWLEHTESVSKKFLTLMVAFFPPITSLKRVGDLQAMSVSPSCLKFAPERAEAILYPRPCPKC